MLARFSGTSFWVLKKLLCNQVRKRFILSCLKSSVNTKISSCVQINKKSSLISLGISQRITWSICFQQKVCHILSSSFENAFLLSFKTMLSRGEQKSKTLMLLWLSWWTRMEKRAARWALKCSMLLFVSISWVFAAKVIAIWLRLSARMI